MQALGGYGFNGRNEQCGLAQRGQSGGEVVVVGCQNANDRKLELADPRVGGEPILQGQPLHGVTGWAVVRLGAEEGVMVRGELSVVEHHGLNRGEASPRLGGE